MRHKQLDRVKDLLGQALGVALKSMPNNQSVAEARSHMKQALAKIDVAQKKTEDRKTMTKSQFEGWWGDVQAGTSELAASPMSPETSQKSLSQLDAMINQEKRKLKDLEKQAQQSTPDQLLSD
jgi:uncharacterized protein YhaN